MQSASVIQPVESISTTFGSSRDLTAAAIVSACLPLNGGSATIVACGYADRTRATYSAYCSGVSVWSFTPRLSTTTSGGAMRSAGEPAKFQPKDSGPAGT